jgi:hypothetical protein
MSLIYVTVKLCWVLETALGKAKGADKKEIDNHEVTRPVQLGPPV